MPALPTQPAVASKPECPPTALACAGSAIITKADLDASGRDLNPLLARQYRTRAGRIEFLHALIDRELIAGEAKARGIDKRPEIQRQVRDFERRLIAKALAAELDLPPPAKTRMRKYYREKRADFVTPERFKVLRAAVRDTSADKMRQQLSGGISASVINADGGSARSLWLSQTDIPPAAWTALHKAWQADRVTEPVKMGGSMYVMRTDAYVEEKTPSFEEVHDEIVNRLAPAQRRLAIEELVRDLREKQTVEVRVENLD